MNFNRFRDFLLLFGLILISIFISLLFAEFFVRSVSPKNLSGSWRIATEKGLFVNKSSGSARHQFGERVVNYTFYKPHLRGTAISKKGLKILVVGDSYTFGWLINKQHTYVQLLQEYADNEFGIDQFQFLNAGAGGAGTADYVAFIEDFGDTINPDIILVFLNTDDIGRSLRKSIYTLESKSLVLKRHSLDSSSLKKVLIGMSGYQWLLENSHLMQLARTAILVNKSDIKKAELETTPIVSGPNSLDLNTSRDSAISLGKHLFSHLNKWRKQRNKYLFVITTGWHNLEDAKTSEEPTKAFMSIADYYFKKQHIPFFDTSPHISIKRAKNPEKYIIAGDGHPNERGHQLIGDTSWHYFIKSQLSEYCLITRRCRDNPNSEF